ncbi:hypothetical protein [Mycobacterium florentinum]|nr:hypothetical protein [Mycobacterium florentinum]
MPTLNADGSFSVSYDDVTMRDVFATQGGCHQVTSRRMIRVGD